MKKYWGDFWFKPTKTLDLAISRFLFFGLLFFIGQAKIDAGWINLPTEFWHPIFIYRYFGWGPPTVQVFEILELAWRCFILFSCFGFLTPLSVLISSVLSLYLLGLRYCYGYYHPEDCLLILASFIFVMAPCSQMFSLDYLMTRRFKPNLVPPTETPRWPQRLIWLIWSLMFFAAAIAKLKKSGLSWVFSDNLRNQIIFNQYLFYFRKTSWTFGSALAQFPLLCQISAAFVILLELSLPVVIFSRRYRYVAILGCLIFQTLNWFVMLVRFDASFVFYIFFIPWSQCLDFIKNKFLKNNTQLSVIKNIK